MSKKFQDRIKALVEAATGQKVLRGTGGQMMYWGYQRGQPCPSLLVIEEDDGCVRFAINHYDRRVRGRSEMVRPPSPGAEVFAMPDEIDVMLPWIIAQSASGDTQFREETAPIRTTSDPRGAPTGKYIRTDRAWKSMKDYYRNK